VSGVVHPGADDNASGTALVVALARAFAAAGGAPRTLVFALFDAEEIGLLGSSQYVREPAVPLPATVAMLNFDMVGRLKNDRVFVGGTDSARGLRDLVAGAARETGLALDLAGTPYQPSDHTRFYEAGVPVLFFFTGGNPDYHRPTDTADRVDAEGLARLAGLAVRLVTRLAGEPRPAWVRVAPPPRRRVSASGAVLGVTADGRGAGDGLRVAGVLPGSGAARAGLRAGDVIVRLAGVSVGGLDEVRRVLAGRRPGDTLPLLYLRDGEARTTAATLGAAP
jgi:hypothetical protein